MMEFEFIEYVKMESGIGRIYLNRPEKRNALCNPLRTELFSCLETLDKDHEIKVIILSGKGSCFCAGYECFSTGPDGPALISKHRLFLTSH